MGNRKTILKGSPNFINFINKTQSAEQVFNFFENKDVYNFFYKNLEDLNKNNQEYFQHIENNTFVQCRLEQVRRTARCMSAPSVCGTT